jgi:hypothetical protein
MTTIEYLLSKKLCTVNPLNLRVIREIEFFSTKNMSAATITIWLLALGLCLRITGIAKTVKSWRGMP